MIRLICSSDNVHLCKQILTFVTSIYRPITLNELTSFAKLPDGAPDDLKSWTEVVSDYLRWHRLFCASVSEGLFAQKGIR
jgi:hypothetical protein